ncbi:tubulin-specific chaperone C [Scleropages formosus]|uniref:Tubulin-specific chaperone C n=1 Tax=Scleropages formosus TaxID=113540 RepID=A0A8C9R6C3_SCLFO|nr:tubulin-specific chaperone C [Scleropages formosus]
MEAVVGAETGSQNRNGEMDVSGAVKIPERLLRREQERQEEVERRREAMESQSVTEEKVDYFSSTFGAERAAIEALLSGVWDADSSRAAQLLEEVSSRTQQLRKFLNDSMAFLTKYECRQAQAALQRLQSSLDEKRQQVLPKKKFNFKARSAAATRTKGVPLPEKAGPLESKPDAKGGADVGIQVVDGGGNSCGFSSAHAQVLTKDPEDIHQRDVLLTHLTGCTVKLLGTPATLHIKDVRDSEVLCGPVSGSVFVDRCSGCTLAFPCQQLRTHNTTDTRVYLHVTSRAIVEDCSGVSFAPFSWSYEGMDAHFEASGLDRGKNNWDKVDDFNWLAADTPSPNWSIIPEAERRTTWD